MNMLEIKNKIMETSGYFLNDYNEDLIPLNELFKVSYKEFIDNSFDTTDNNLALLIYSLEYIIKHYKNDLTDDNKLVLQFIFNIKNDFTYNISEKEDIKKDIIIKDMNIVEYLNDNKILPKNIKITIENIIESNFDFNSDIRNVNFDNIYNNIINNPSMLNKENLTKFNKNLLSDLINNDETNVLTTTLRDINVNGEINSLLSIDDIGINYFNIVNMDYIDNPKEMLLNYYKKNYDIPYNILTKYLSNMEIYINKRYHNNIDIFTKNELIEQKDFLLKHLLKKNRAYDFFENDLVLFYQILNNEEKKEFLQHYLSLVNNFNNIDKYSNAEKNLYNISKEIMIDYINQENENFPFFALLYNLSNRENSIKCDDILSELLNNKSHLLKKYIKNALIKNAYEFNKLLFKSRTDIRYDIEKEIVKNYEEIINNNDSNIILLNVIQNACPYTDAAFKNIKDTKVLKTIAKLYNLEINDIEESNYREDYFYDINNINSNNYLIYANLEYNPDMIYEKMKSNLYNYSINSCLLHFENGTDTYKKNVIDLVKKYYDNKEKINFEIIKKINNFEKHFPFIVIPEQDYKEIIKENIRNLKNINPEKKAKIYEQLFNEQNYDLIYEILGNIGYQNDEIVDEFNQYFVSFVKNKIYNSLDDEFLSFMIKCNQLLDSAKAAKNLKNLSFDEGLTLLKALDKNNNHNESLKVFTEKNNYAISFFDRNKLEYLNYIYNNDINILIHYNAINTYDYSENKKTNKEEALISRAIIEKNILEYSFDLNNKYKGNSNLFSDYTISNILPDFENIDELKEYLSSVNDLTYLIIISLELNVNEEKQKKQSKSKYENYVLSQIFDVNRYENALKILKENNLEVLLKKILDVNYHYSFYDYDKKELEKNEIKSFFNEEQTIVLLNSLIKYYPEKFTNIKHLGTYNTENVFRHYISNCNESNILNNFITSKEYFKQYAIDNFKDFTMLIHNESVDYFINVFEKNKLLDNLYEKHYINEKSQFNLNLMNEIYTTDVKEILYRKKENQILKDVVKNLEQEVKKIIRKKL